MVQTIVAMVLLFVKSTHLSLMQYSSVHTVKAQAVYYSKALNNLTKIKNNVSPLQEQHLNLRFFNRLIAVITLTTKSNLIDFFSNNVI